MHSPLPLPWVDSLFARLGVRYGRAFLSQYEGYDIDAVKADWASQLGGFSVLVDDKPDAPAIAWALENLPAGNPPNAMQFRQICRGYNPPAHPLGLPAPPREVPERFKNALAQLAVPLEDERPEKVRVAARFIEMWGTEGVKLSPLKSETLKEMRRIVGEYEAQEKARKAREDAERERRQLEAAQQEASTNANH